MVGGAARREQAAFAVAAIVLVAGGLHWLWGPELPPGVDATGHLTRLDVGLSLLADGRLDGWFDRAMFGYQTHLMYGPGLALAVGAVRVLSLGLLSIAGAYEVVGVLGLLAVVPTTATLTRAFGAPVGAARAAGILALAVSSGRGGGIQGAFDLGLMPNHVAVPLVLLAWAWMLRPRDQPVVLGLLVGSVALTHPQSLVVLAAFAPLVLAAGWACGVVDRSRWRRLVAGALVAAGTTAWWWVPAVVHRDLRGILTSWDLPTMGEHLRLVLDGERGWIGPAAFVVAVAWAGAVGYGAATRDRVLLAMAALPVLSLGLLHVVEALLVDRFPEVVLLPNRGLVYACYLAAPVVGIALHRAFQAWEPGAWVLAGVAVAGSLGLLRPPPSTFDRPLAAMHDTADDLDRLVADGQRFAYVESDVDRTGVPAPGRWLGWTSGRINLGPFGAEYAPGVVPTLMVFEPPDAATVDAWVERVRPMAVSHLVAGDPATHEVLASATSLRLVARHEPLSIWEIEGDAPFEVVDADRERLVVDVGARHARSLSLPLGYSPGWSGTLDDEPASLGRGADGRLTVDLPPGPHRISLRWHEPTGHAAGRVITLLALVALVATRLRRRRTDGRLRP